MLEVAVGKEDYVSASLVFSQTDDSPAPPLTSLAPSRHKRRRKRHRQKMAKRVAVDAMESYFCQSIASNVEEESPTISISLRDWMARKDQLPALTRHFSGDAWLRMAKEDCSWCTTVDADRDGNTVIRSITHSNDSIGGDLSAPGSSIYENTIFVDNIKGTKRVTISSIRNHFEFYGRVKCIRGMRATPNRIDCGCFVQFHSYKAAQAAVSAHNKGRIANTNITGASDGLKTASKILDDSRGMQNDTGKVDEKKKRKIRRQSKQRRIANKRRRRSNTEPGPISFSDAIVLPRYRWKMLRDEYKSEQKANATAAKKGLFYDGKV